MQVLYAVGGSAAQEKGVLSTGAITEQPETKGGKVSLRRLFPWPALVIAVVALAALVPMLFLGLPSGHDFEFHLNSWMEVAQQWKEGVVFPRWASGAHYQFGEARFIFYPPGSWLLGALLSLALPWPLVPAAYVWIALVAAGISMFFLARRFLSTPAAIFVAALYAVNPYHLVIVYWRSAFAELLASCLLPLLLLFLLRWEQQGKKIIVPLTLIVAAGWLANAPAAVMINYSLALIVLVLAVLRRSPRVLGYGAVAVVLGAALAAFYVLPAAYEEKWVNISEVLAPGIRPQDNFLFTHMADPDHNHFNLLVSLVAIAEIAVMLVVGYFARNESREDRPLWWTVASWSAGSAILMLSPTFFFWEHLPKLRFVQLPWRWLLCLNVGFAIFACMGARRWIVRAAICALMIAVLAGVWLKVQVPWWDSAADIIEMHDNLEEGRGYEGADEYVPAGADAYEVKQDSPEIAVQGSGKARINIERWQAESRQFAVAASSPANLVLHLFNYPAWHVEVNGHPVKAESQETTGQMVIPVPAGENRVSVTFVRTWDRKLGGIVSLLALALTIALAVGFDMKEPA
jgi:6-pyruvoyl-tetrahydropterin synthase related domain